MCHVYCLEQRNTLNQQCNGNEGFEWEWTDKENCIGQCKDSCEEEKEALTEQCGGAEGLKPGNGQIKKIVKVNAYTKIVLGQGEETLNEAKARCESDYSPGNVNVL